MAAAPASTPTTPSRCGAARRATPPRRRRWSTPSPREPAEPGALQLVPFAKAYSGLTDAEFAQVDRVIRAHTLEKFGPVRSVRPTLVFELGFEGINRSPRHKSGIAVRFPRMLRIRHDKPLHEADRVNRRRAHTALLHLSRGP
jgi:ATP-dependent DNA ligase